MPYDKKDFVVRLQKSTPLPPELHFSEPGIEPDSTHLDAYSLALQLAQIRAWPKTPRNASKKWPDKLPPPLASRILGYLLTEVPVKEATRVAREITSCRKDTRMLESSVDDLYRLADLARFYSLTLIKTCTKAALHAYCPCAEACTSQEIQWEDSEHIKPSFAIIIRGRAESCGGSDAGKR